MTSKVCSFDLGRTLSSTIRSSFGVNIKILIFLQEIVFWLRMDYLVYNQTYIQCENRDFHRFIEDVPFTWYKKTNKCINFFPYQFPFSRENEINLKIRFPDADCLWSNFMKNNLFAKKPLSSLKKSISKNFKKISKN
jgi:hypothetical protein